MTDFDDILGADPSPIDTRAEKAIQNDTLERLSARPRSLYWRHNTGQGWQGTRLRLRTGLSFRVEPGMVVLRNARPVTFGLPGSADIIGSEQGLPVAVEMKDADGRQHQQQEVFERMWTRAGGIYIIARSVADAERKVNRAVTDKRAASG